MRATWTGLCAALTRARAREQRMLVRRGCRAICCGEGGGGGGVRGDALWNRAEHRAGEERAVVPVGGCIGAEGEFFTFALAGGAGGGGDESEHQEKRTQGGGRRGGAGCMIMGRHLHGLFERAHLGFEGVELMAWLL
jgi:hypothetical protein